MEDVKKPRRVQAKLKDLLTTPSARRAFEDADAALEAGSAIRALRKTAGLTQEELAKALDISQARISAIENGEGRDGPSYALLKRIAAACKVKGPILTFAEVDDSAGSEMVETAVPAPFTISDDGGHVFEVEMYVAENPFLRVLNRRRTGFERAWGFSLNHGKRTIAKVKLTSDAPSAAGSSAPSGMKRVVVQSQAVPDKAGER